MRAISNSRTESFRIGEPSHRDCRRPAGGADQRAGERRLDQAQQLQRMGVEILAAAAAPDPDVADIAAADVTVGIDAPVQSVAGEKIVEELGPHQIALRHHLRDQRRLAARLQLEGDGIALLVIAVVGGDVGRIHVEEHGLVETAGRVLPDEGGVVIGLQQFEQMMADGLAHVALAEVLGQQPEDARQHPALGSGDIHDGADPSGEPPMQGNRRSTRVALLGLDPGVLDHLAPALFLAAQNSGRVAAGGSATMTRPSFDASFLKASD